MPWILQAMVLSLRDARLQVDRAAIEPLLLLHPASRIPETLDLIRVMHGLSSTP